MRYYRVVFMRGYIASCNNVQFSVECQQKIPHQLSLFLSTFTKLRKATIGFDMSVRPSVCPCVHQSAGSNSAPTEGMFMEYDI